MKFLKSKADLGRATACGWTPAHEAAANGHIEVLRFFYSVGVDLAKRTHSGWTPAHEDTSHGHFKAVSFLQEMLGKAACLGGSGANDIAKESVPFPADAMSWSMPPPIGGRLVYG